MVWVALVFSATILIMTFVGCSTFAEYIEEYVPDLVEPGNVVLEQDFAQFTYKKCYQDVCLTRLHEFRNIEIELAGGEVLECTTMYMEWEHPDGSRTVWLFPTTNSDKRCESAMEKLARDEDG